MGGMMKMTLWSDNKTEDEIAAEAVRDAESTVYNLLEDIQCLKEDVKKLRKKLRKSGVMLRSMEEAPKDGTKIVIMWATPNVDINEYDIRISWWWNPTCLIQWENGARPHWEYISDKFACMSIEEPLGWLPIPKANTPDKIQEDE